MRAPSLIKDGAFLFAANPGKAGAGLRNSCLSISPAMK